MPRNVPKKPVLILTGNGRIPIPFFNFQKSECGKSSTSTALKGEIIVIHLRPTPLIGNQVFYLFIKRPILTAFHPSSFRDNDTMISQFKDALWQFYSRSNYFNNTFFYLTTLPDIFSPTTTLIRGNDILFPLPPSQ